MRLLPVLLWGCMLLSPEIVSATGAELLSLARSHIDRREYYSAITECMRYQYCYPDGGLFPRSLHLMGEAYYRGGNYYEGIAAMAKCHERFRNTEEGEWSLLSIGYMRFMMGSPLFAQRTYQEYDYLYPKGRFAEEVSIDTCYTLALQYDLETSRTELKRHGERYPDGRYLAQVQALQRLIDEQVNRPEKSLALAITGSLVLPGFGHFYTGKYATGFLTLITNAALIYLTYDGFRDDNDFRMIFFGLTGLTFYQYSLYSAVRNVYEYNSREGFYRNVRLSARTHF